MLDDYFKNPEQYASVRYLDDDPALAARLHCDKDLRLGVVQTCQILSNVWHLQDLSKCHVVLINEWQSGASYIAPYGELKSLASVLAGGVIYNPRHLGHPSTTWAAMYGGNYEWLYRLGMELLAEFTLRFDRVHACTPVLRTLEMVPPSLVASIDTWCDAPAVLPSEYLVEFSANSYMNYYRKGKIGLLTYTRRLPPEWLPKAQHINEQE